ncbi:SMC5-SMC6 complex localization factor protein 2 isoform X2 [Festucalex cinctus]
MTITNDYFTFKMKNGAENKGDSRTFKNMEYYSPRSKETPMKPFQVNNCLVAPPRRMLPFRSPEVCQSYSPTSPYQLSYHLTPVRSSESHRPEHAKYLSGLQLSAMLQPRPPVTASAVAKTQDKSPSISHGISPHPNKGLSTHTRSGDIRREHNSSPASDSEKNATVQRTLQERLATPSSGKSSPAKSLDRHKPFQKWPAVTLDRPFQKRRRESEDNDAGAKKSCVRVEPPKPPLRSPPRTFPASLPMLKLSETPNERATCFDSSPKSKPVQLPCMPSKPTVTKNTFLGARQLRIHSTHGDIIQLGSLCNDNGDVFKRALETCDKRENKVNAEVQPKNINPPHFSPPWQPQHVSSESPVRTLKHKTHNSPHESPSKRNCSLSTPPAKCNKLHHRRRTIPNDYDELFTPDVIISPVRKADKTKIDEETAEKTPGCSSTIKSSENSCSKGENSGSTCSIKLPISSKHLNISLPYVSLVRLNIKDIEPFYSTCGKSKDYAELPARRHRTHGSLKHDEEKKAKKPSTSCWSRSPPIKSREGHRPHADETDSVDEDLDLSLGIGFDLESSQTSKSSEEEQLVPLREIMNHFPKIPLTPDKDAALSEPSTPGGPSHALKAEATISRGSYRNNLDQMLKEIDTQKKAKDSEAQLRTLCDEELLGVAEYNEEENRDEGSSEQREFLQRYSLEYSVIREVPPGEVVFHLDKFGQIFNQDSLQLRQYRVKPQSPKQKTLLWSSPSQLKLQVKNRLFQEAYGSQSPCPTQVTDFLFKMMSVHSERMLSEEMLQALCDIAISAAYNIVKNKNSAFTVWVPTLADLTLVLMNMGVAFVTLFPFENLQPAFTEGDLLRNVYIQSECPPRTKEWNMFPEHNCNNIMKYLSYCMTMCPKVYSDYELLLLLTVMARVALDTHFITLAGVEINELLNKIVSNIREWDAMLPRLCHFLTDLTDDHHNMCVLVQLLPDNARGKCLRQHLSLSMISKLLDGTSCYRPTGKEIKLATLKPYVAAMQPASLRRFILNTSSRSSAEEDMTFLDQQSYYLCYSLLTLTNVASDFHVFPTHQKEHLLTLSSDLRAHVICHIRESEKCLYRSKVKDLLARIYTKWQMIHQRIQPLHSKICDYWKPSSAGSLTCSGEERDNSLGWHAGGEDAAEVNESTTSEEEDPPSTEPTATSPGIELHHATDAQENSCHRVNAHGGL